MHPVALLGSLDGPRLPAERPHAHGVTQAGDLGAAGLHPVPQFAGLRELAQEPGPAPPSLGVGLLL